MYLYAASVIIVIGNRNQCGAKQLVDDEVVLDPDDILEPPLLSVQGSQDRRQTRHGLGPVVPRVHRRRLPAVPIVETRKGPVQVSMPACDALLDRIRHLESGQRVLRTFQRGGLAGPIELDLNGKRQVVEAISLMMGEGEVDPQLRKLWKYLRDELTA